MINLELNSIYYLRFCDEGKMDFLEKIEFRAFGVVAPVKLLFALAIDVL